MKLDKLVQAELIELARQYEKDSEEQYRAVVRRVSQLRAFVKGEPADWFDSFSYRWRPFNEHPNHNPEQDREYDYHINICQAWWQILQGAIQTVGIPGSIFRPQNPRQSADVEAAKTAKEIIDYQRTVVDFRDLLMQVYRYFYTDGIVLGYVRSVKDRKFGTHTVSVDITETQEISASYQCFNCNAVTPEADVLRAISGESTEEGIFCPQCMSPLYEENLIPASTEETVVGTEEKEEDNSREIVDLFGALESFLPWWASDLQHCNYAKIATEVAKEDVIASFPELEDDVTGEATEDGKIERQARAAAKSPQGSTIRNGESGFVTYARWWLRPVCFYKIGNKEIRDKLLKQFPDGMFFQLAGDVFLDAVPEKMEDKLVLMRPLKGDGMYTPSLGQNGVPIQESLNEAWNMQLEAMEVAAFPPGLLDSEMLSGQAMNDTRMKPGIWKEVKVPPTKKLGDSWGQMTIQDTSQSMQNFIQSAAPWGEILMGAERVLQGGPITNVRTLGGQAQARSQALQRQAPAYEAAKNGMAGIQERLVNEFLQNRTEEVYFEVTGEQGMEERKIQLGVERGKVVAFSELSESIPQTWAQKQESWRMLLEVAGQNPIVQSWFAEPTNTKLHFESIGLPELRVPGAALVEKYEKIIQELLQMAPVQEVMPSDPMTGTPEQAVTSPAIPFDPVLDDPMIALKVIQEWAASPEGMEAQRTNPNFANVRAYAEQAAMLMQQQAMAQQQAQQPTEEQPAA